MWSDSEIGFWCCQVLDQAPNNEKKCINFFTRREHVSSKYALLKFILLNTREDAATLISNFYCFGLRNCFLKPKSEDKNIFSKISSKEVL